MSRVGVYAYVTRRRGGTLRINRIALYNITYALLLINTLLNELTKEYIDILNIGYYIPNSTGVISN